MILTNIQDLNPKQTIQILCTLFEFKHRLGEDSRIANLKLLQTKK
jgi:hypothetical protein